MGLFSSFFGQKTTVSPQLISIMPLLAIDEIKNGNLPVLATDTVILKKDEKLHYVDKAIYLQKNIKKRYKSNHFGISLPGFFKGNRIHLGDAESRSINDIIVEQKKGILYITNKRIIFIGKDVGIEKSINKVTAIKPYTNGIELQFGNNIITFFVPDGAVLNLVIKLLN